MSLKSNEVPVAKLKIRHALSILACKQRMSSSCRKLLSSSPWARLTRPSEAVRCSPTTCRGHPQILVSDHPHFWAPSTFMNGPCDVMQTAGDVHPDGLRELDDLTAFLLSSSSPAALHDTSNCKPSSDFFPWPCNASTPAQPVVQLLPASNMAMVQPQPVSFRQHSSPVPQSLLASRGGFCCHCLFHMPWSVCCRILQNSANDSTVALVRLQENSICVHITNCRHGHHSHNHVYSLNHHATMLADNTDFIEHSSG